MHRQTPLNPTFARRRHRGMTLVELAVGLAMLGTLMGSLVVVNRAVRLDAAELDTRHTLRQLQAALRVYRADHDAAPAGDTAEALLALMQHSAAAERVRDLPITGRESGEPTLRDGFGRPLRYQPPIEDRHLPATFVSAGPSGRFGAEFDLDADTFDAPAAGRHAAVDNLYGYELEAPRP